MSHYLLDGHYRDTEPATASEPEPATDAEFRARLMPADGWPSLFVGGGGHRRLRPGLSGPGYALDSRGEPIVFPGVASAEDDDPAEDRAFAAAFADVPRPRYAEEAREAERQGAVEREIEAPLAERDHADRQAAARERTERLADSRWQADQERPGWEE